jgi:transcriptional regulator with XRE-family HTH domain/tetratricopeptide (TPR) repeat protein
VDDHPSGTDELRRLLRDHRLRADLTLEALAERSGVSDRAISDIERGVSLGPRPRTMAALADALTLGTEDRAALLASARSGRQRRTADVGDGAPDLQPSPLADFSGRDEQLDRLLEAVRSPSPGTALPVVVSGIPGVGKTSLALECVRRAALPGRQAFVDLGGIDARPPSPLQVVREVLRQLTGDAEDQAGSLDDAVARWVRLTVDGPVTVVLDDAANEQQVRPLLAGSGRAVLLVTSRRTLAGLGGAVRVSVGAMSRPESVAFLTTALRGTRTTTAELDELAALCGDLPIALRVAASRIASRPAWSVSDFLRRLRDEGRRLRSLAAGDLRVEPAFAASFAQLGADHQAMFCSLTLLKGSSFSAELAGAAAGTDVDTASDLLDDLADLGLVEALTGDRFRVHDLLRLYARHRLQDDLSDAQVRARSADLDRWLLTAAAQAGMAFAPPAEQRRWAEASAGAPLGQREARAWLTTEVDHWSGALRRRLSDGDAATVARLGPAIEWFADRWFAWGHWHEFFGLLTEAAVAVGDVTLEITSQLDLAFMQISELFAPRDALETLVGAEKAAMVAGDARRHAQALSLRADALFMIGDHDGALAAARASVELYAPLRDLQGELQPRQTLAQVLALSDPEAALRAHQDVIDITEDPTADLSDNFRFVTRSTSMGYLARVLLSLGRYDEALALSSRLVDAGRAEADVPTQAKGHRHRGYASLGLGDHARAAVDLSLALELAGDHRPPDWAAEIEATLAEIRGEPDT